MTITITAHGVNVTGINVNGGDQQVNKNGNRIDVQAEPHDTLRINYERFGDGSIDVSPLGDAERQKGWRQLGSTNGQVLAYQVDDNQILLLGTPNLGDWMGALPDDWALADVTVPGTHESAATSGGFVSQCQDRDIRQQLEDGIRFFDIRLKWINNELQTYHGIQPMNGTLRQQVEWINDFLRNHNREVVVCSIKQEDADEQDFPGQVEELLKESGLWRFDEFLPTLGEARGKACFFSRFGKKQDSQFPNGQGIKPLSWSNNLPNGFDADIHGTNMRIHDWYDTGDVPAKARQITQHLDGVLDNRGGGNGANHPFSLTYASAATFPSASPRAVACGGGAQGGIGGAVSMLANLTKAASSDNGAEGGVNDRLARYLIRKGCEGRRPRATIALDFYNETGSGRAGIAELIVALNFIDNAN